MNGTENVQGNHIEMTDLVLDGWQIVHSTRSCDDNLATHHCHWVILFNKNVEALDTDSCEALIDRASLYLNQMLKSALPYQIGDLVTIHYSQFNGYVDQVYNDHTLDVSYDVYENCRITSHYRFDQVDFLANVEAPSYYRLLKDINMSEVYDVGDYVVKLNDLQSNELYLVKDIVDDDLYLVEGAHETGSQQLLSSQQMVKYPLPILSKTH